MFLIVWNHQIIIKLKQNRNIIKVQTGFLNIFLHDGSRDCIGIIYKVTCPISLPF